MNFKLVKLMRFSGFNASVYSIYMMEERKTLFDRFIDENNILLISEINSIFARLYTIGHFTGAREHYFKMNEGNPGDGICALYDDPDKRLRLYCIRYGSSLIILGGGGPKAKGIRAFQKDEKLKCENYLLRELSHRISYRIQKKEINYSDDYRELEGNLIFYEQENE